MPEPIWIGEKSRELLDERLADRVENALRDAIGARGRATLVLSGGSTPRNFLRLLSRRQLPWEALEVTLADDRWVPPDHVDSNERLVRDNLLTGPASAASFVPLVTKAAHPRDAEDEIDARLRSLGTFDVTILGMGGDGHFASLFPESAELRAGLDLASTRVCIGLDPPSAPHARMSMTLARILDSRALLLHLTGDDKRAVLEEARREGDPLRLPIAALLATSSPPLEIYWAP